MESGKYYVISAGNNLTESMTKEQILSAITQAVESHTIADVDTGFVEKIKEQNSATNLKFWVGSTAQYNALATKEQGCFYLLTDDPQFEDMESSIENLLTDVAQLQSDFASLTEPNKILYGNETQAAILSGDETTPVSFYIPIGNTAKYKEYAVVIADTDDLDTATDIQKILIYVDEIRQAEDDFIFIIDNKVNRIEESPELANSLRAVSYDIDIRIEGVTATQTELTLICNRVYLNLTSRAETSTKFYLHKLIGVI